MGLDRAEWGGMRFIRGRDEVYKGERGGFRATILNLWLRSV